MAHLFLASRITMPDDPHMKGGVRIPRSVSRIPVSISAEKLSREKTRRDHSGIVTTRVPHVNEAQLTAATSAANVSHYCCAVAFGTVVLVAGAVVTAVAFAFNSHKSSIMVVGVVLLVVGVVMLGSALCWTRTRTRKKKQDKRRESQTALMV